VSYPQPQASQEVIEGQEIFRLKTPLVSSGDIYEVDTSATAFAIGPESDIQNARITYYDPTKPGRSESFVISAGSPFAARIDSFASSKFPTSNTQARILISPEDIINNQWTTQLTSVGWSSIVPPTLDVIGYLGAPPRLTEMRPDRFYKGRLGFNGQDRSILAVPLYGRRYASVTAGRFFASAGAQMGLLGAQLLTDVYGGVEDLNTQFVALTALPDSLLGDGASITLEYRASAHGYFDYLILNFFTGGDNTIDPAVEDAIYYVARVADKED
jgi:hypothetical protein